MQLAAPTARSPLPGNLAEALHVARDTLGHRPAVTVLGSQRRDEQGVASLAQWAAKGAHLLELDLLLEPGDVLTLDAPIGWTTAAVCLACWWSGVAVSVGGPPGTVAVVEEGRDPPPGADDVLWLGGAVDGAPTTEVDGEAWVHAVQTFPDQAPPPRATAELPALVGADGVWSQAELLRAAAALPGAGTLGLEDPEAISPVTALAALVVRPLLVGRPTVVLRGVDRDAAAGERVTTWR